MTLILKIIPALEESMGGMGGGIIPQELSSRRCAIFRTSLQALHVRTKASLSTTSPLHPSSSPPLYRLSGTRRKSVIFLFGGTKVSCGSVGYVIIPHRDDFNAGIIILHRIS